MRHNSVLQSNHVFYVLSLCLRLRFLQKCVNTFVFSVFRSLSTLVLFISLCVFPCLYVCMFAGWQMHESGVHRHQRCKCDVDVDIDVDSCICTTKFLEHFYDLLSHHVQDFPLNFPSFDTHSLALSLFLHIATYCGYGRQNVIASCSTRSISALQTKYGALYKYVRFNKYDT